MQWNVQKTQTILFSQLHVLIMVPDDAGMALVQYTDRSNCWEKYMI